MVCKEKINLQGSAYYDWQASFDQGALTLFLLHFIRVSSSPLHSLRDPVCYVRIFVSAVWLVCGGKARMDGILYRAASFLLWLLLCFKGPDGGGAIGGAMGGDNVKKSRYV